MPPRPQASVFLDYHVDRCYVDIPIDLLVDPPDHLPHTTTFASAAPHLPTVLLRKGCDRESTLTEFRTSVIQTDIQSVVCLITREQAIILGYVCLMGDISF